MLPTGRGESKVDMFNTTGCTCPPMAETAGAETPGKKMNTLQQIANINKTAARYETSYFQIIINTWKILLSMQNIPPHTMQLCNRGCTGGANVKSGSRACVQSAMLTR